VYPYSVKLKRFCSKLCYTKYQKTIQPRFSFYWSVKDRASHLRPNLTPSPELAYVIGVVLGDGCLDRSHYAVRLKAKDFDFTEEFNSSICRVLNKAKPYAINREHKYGHFIVAATSKSLYLFLKNGMDSYEPIIDKYSSEFIRGFADSEGTPSYSGKRRNPVVRIVNTNLTLLKYIQRLLRDRFQIESRIQPQRLNPSVTKDGRVITPKKTFFRLVIGKRKCVIKFKEAINFSISRKRNKLEELCDAGKKTIESLFT
jgi:intein-encoded DNA endonuclease-like protein